MPNQEQLAREPFCHKGCAHVYAHERQCSPPDGYEVTPLPEEYAKLGTEKLLEVLEGLYADYNRYSQTPLDWDSPLREYHRPTVSEAARRIQLINSMIVVRTGGV